MNTVHDRIREFRLRIQVGPGKREYDYDGWEHDAYRVRLIGPGGKMMTLRYRKGLGHAGSPPQLDEVLDAIAADSASVENADGFADWANEFGYDTDSRKAEATYKACVKQAKDARALLGDANYDLLLWHTERL